jgi:DNA polymerase
VTYLIIDFESRSVRDLRKVGHWHYAADPSTVVLCAAYCIDNGPVQFWKRGEPVPEAIVKAAADPNCLFIAHNAGFEIPMLRLVLVPLGWPEIPLERWRCTMAAALAMALPAALGQAAAALGLPQQKADARIVNQTSKPRLPRAGEDPSGIYWFDDAEHLQALYDYCRQDIETERALWQWLRPLPPVELLLWRLDQIINARGFYSDAALIEKALAIIAAIEEAACQELPQITDGEITTGDQIKKIRTWLAARCCKLEDLKDPTVTKALRDKELTPVVRRVLELRQQVSHASANKFAAMRNWRGTDGRIRGCFRFCGAATGRWSAGGPQPHNFRKEVGDLLAKFEAVMSGDLDIVRKLGAPIEICGDLARAGIAAPPRRKLLVGDFSAIESRTLAWLTGETSKLALWSRFDETRDPNDDPYVVIGRWLGRPPATARKFGKIADLAFGYGGGLGAYKNFAPDNDTATDQQIEAYKQTWRAQHPQTVQFWYGLGRAAIQAMYESPVRYGRLTLRLEQHRDAPFLFITLPSGRDLSYPYARLIRNDRGDVVITYMDNSITNGGWSEYRPGRGMWGGVFTENVTQAVARDLLGAAMLRLEATGYPIVLHVHDSIVVEVPDGEDI